VLGYEVLVGHTQVNPVQAAQRHERLGAVLARLRRETKRKR
jgi:hypothetical protein